MAVEVDITKTGGLRPERSVTEITEGAAPTLGKSACGVYWSNLASGSATSVTLPPAANVPHVCLRFVKYSAIGVFTITRNGSDTVNNLAANYTLSNDQQYVHLQSDGVDNWIVLAEGTA
jgi:hypothetical protein